MQVKWTVLSPEEMSDREAIANTYMYLVDSISMSYRRRIKHSFLDVDDLKSAGLVGLTMAINDYDARKGGRTFGSYAYTLIRFSVVGYLSKQRELKHIMCPLDDVMELSNTDMRECADNSGLHLAITALKPTYRTVIKKRLEGYTLVQISQQLNLNKSALADRNRHALNALKKLMAA